MIQATNKEKSAAFEWLRKIALGEDDKLSDDERSRLAAVALAEWHDCKTQRELASRPEGGDTLPVLRTSLEWLARQTLENDQGHDAYIAMEAVSMAQRILKLAGPQSSSSSEKT